MTFVIDASVAIKWVVEEPESEGAALLLSRPLAAPDLLLAECANILWKKVRRGDVSAETALIAAGGLRNTGIELIPAATVFEKATRMAIELRHPAYDCLYLAVAAHMRVPFVTADLRLLRRLREAGAGVTALSISEATTPRGN